MTTKNIKLAKLDPDLLIELWQYQNKKAMFKVVYFKQVKDNLTYSEAITEFGSCVFHSLACKGELNNDGTY